MAHTCPVCGAARSTRRFCRTCGARRVTFGRWERPDGTKVSVPLDRIAWLASPWLWPRWAMLGFVASVLGFFVFCVAWTAVAVAVSDDLVAELVMDVLWLIVGFFLLVRPALRVLRRADEAP